MNLIKLIITEFSKSIFANKSNFLVTGKYRFGNTKLNGFEKVAIITYIIKGELVIEILVT